MNPAPRYSRAFLRTLLIPMLLLIFSRHLSDLSAQGSDLEIFLDWPNEGETLYAGPGSLLHKIPVKGRVVFGDYLFNELEVELDVISEGSSVGKMLGEISSDGSFEFEVTVNPHGPMQEFEIAFAECGYQCHSSGLLDLPPGELTLAAKVMAPGGVEAESRRRILVDISGEAIVPVQLVVDNAVGQNVSGITVSASTRIYLWRSRFFSGTSDENGLAAVIVEALNHSPTEYIFSVDRQIIDGVLYEGSDSQSVTLPPAADGHQLVSISVMGRGGNITGSIVSESASHNTGIPVWAIREHSGETLSTRTGEDGAFAFENISLEQYLVTLDINSLLIDGFNSEGQYLNLRQNPDSETQIKISEAEGQIVEGIVTTEDGTFLPFAWISVENANHLASNLPSDGSYLLPVPSDDPVSLLAHAPGYYGQREEMNRSTDLDANIDFVLKRQDETELLKWGGGEVIIPAESDVARDEVALTLRRGWLWGHIEGEPLLIEVAGKELLLSDASFSVEYIPSKRAWLYINEGTALINPGGRAKSVRIEDGQMINLLNDGGLTPVPLDPVVVQALRGESDRPLPITWEPSIRSRIGSAVRGLSVGLVQVITFVTYFIVSLGVLLIPLTALYWWMKRRARRDG